MSLVEICRLVLDRTRAWQDIDALPPTARLTARLNLHRLLDLAEDWSPLTGRPSLTAFLDYLDLMEGEPAEELDSAHLSGEDAVTMVTVHRAKGLEWDVVAVPAVVDQNFPSRSQQFPDPVRFPEHLPIELRIDTAFDAMPDDEQARTAYLRQRHEMQEWRTAYVAATRARSVLMVTGSYWYGLPEPSMTAKKPSALFELVESHPGTRVAGHAAEPPRPALLRWAAGAEAPDPLFEAGWAAALRAAIADPATIDALADSAGVRSRYDELVESFTGTLFEVRTTGDGAPRPAPLKQVSVTSLVTYAQCPKRYYWSVVDRLPRRRNPAATAGTEVHRRIELHQRGQVPFDVVEPGFYDVPDGGTGPGAFDSFLGSRFAERDAALVEAPFEILSDNGFVIKGRMDAVYIEDGAWEIVDFKSGKPKEETGRIVQLQAYAVAASDADLGHPKPTSLDVTFAYLGAGVTEQRFHADDSWLEQAREDIARITNGIDQEEFAAVPADWCSSCDFLRFCEPGRAWLER
jgi:DNA helicase-2/ATP-dependent DNA helicase PcrA